MASVVLKNICKSYDQIPVSKNIDLEIEKGEFVAFVGPSGCGKSTLLRLIAGLEEITDGDLYIGDTRVNDLPPKDRSVGMVFQSYALYPHMNVAENMAFSLKLQKTDKTEAQRRVLAAAETLQLSALLDRKPKDLSGGQRQRVAIGRTMVREPQVLLFDEPLSNLDASLRVKMRIEIAKLHKRLEATMIYVTHDQVEAMTLADKIVVLDGGRVSQVGSPLELYHYPANRFVAGFIGSPQMNFIDAQVLSVSESAVELTLPGSKQITIPVDGSNLVVGELVSLGVRPEHFVGPEQADCCLESRVNLAEHLGNETQIYLDMEGAPDGLTVRQPGSIPAKEDSSFTLGINADSCHLFQQNGEACRRLFPEPSLNY
ncbi:maltose/maltodextrin ABC transporter ATP-binding protein MalK [Motiliproteus sp. MSK22-1]|uniref:maltose/maltodextrin ABC transporter ATP-binding protein MalK n=1 Tax=Motiliproteus sp. MSK22-1 TaxID=1897630 RepID=UPI000978605E|nr:maltose/maltodextrin ABC transporter ATP-binding protein MalK [Motiliproteus sp. MSK22-1]OMH29107.1 ABC transporter [Motiliproteus sp. MSK22-1]